MRPIADCLPFLPSPRNSQQTNTKTSAPYPVWSGSTTKPVRFVPLPKQEAVKLFHKAREFERQTRKPGKQDGDVSSAGIKILYVLLFDCINYQTGRLDPSQKTIARKANISERSVTRGLAKLKACGILNWINRAEVIRDEKGRYCPKQNTNAYAVLPVSQWKGFVDTKPTPPLPHPSTWGAVPPLPDLITQALTELRLGERATALRLLETDPADTVAGALARYWKALNQQTSQ
jgi:hypothetical protein